jgi:hypothetical protein
MCFSAHASFTAGAILLGVGVAALRKTTKPSQRPFAAIPVVFSVQQFLEGLLWVSLGDEAFAAFYTPSMYLYLFIAMSLWPLWVPLSVWVLEEAPGQKKKLMVPIVLGAMASAFYLICLLFFGASAQVDCYHVQYALGYPYSKYVELLYVMATAAPFFLSSWKRMPVFGFSLLASLAVTLIFYKQFSLSVWCFFAAVLSVQVLWAVVVNNAPQVRKTENVKATTSNRSRH